MTLNGEEFQGNSLLKTAWHRQLTKYCQADKDIRLIAQGQSIMQYINQGTVCCEPVHLGKKNTLSSICICACKQCNEKAVRMVVVSEA